MRQIAILVIGTAVALAMFTGRASAQQYPGVANLKPFSAQTKYMSLPGYLRYLVHQRSQQWLSYGEAGRIVKQQGG